jgi:hypothetical protein
VSDDRYCTPEEFEHIEALVRGNSRPIRQGPDRRRQQNIITPPPRRKQANRARLRAEIQRMKLAHEPLSSQYFECFRSGVSHLEAIQLVEGHIK